jgi:hypothetical protein
MERGFWVGKQEMGCNYIMENSNCIVYCVDIYAI